MISFKKFKYKLELSLSSADSKCVELELIKN